MSDDRLRELWQQDGGEAGGCPDDGRIFDAVAGRLPPDEVAPIVDHLATCGACAISWRVARALTDGPGAAVQQRPAPANGGRWLGLGVLVAAVAVGLLLVVGTGEPPPVYRDAPGEIALTAGVAEEQAEGVRLSWAASAPGATYRVRVVTADLDTVATSPWLDLPEWTVPSEQLADAAPGARLRWQVEATWADGRVVRSPTWDLDMP